MSGRAHNEAGVSLIETLVAVAIIGIVATAVVLSIQPGSDPLDEEADRLLARLVFAEQDAISTGQPVGVVIEGFGAGYSFHRYVDQRWWPVRDVDALGAHILETGFRLRVDEAILAAAIVGEGEERPVIPAFWFDPAGMTEPFRLRLEDAGTVLELVWTGDADTRWEVID
ncbi:GspH/FimT family pseudopilin [Maricaulis sp. MIT060901]|uniref:GspH/FimT family pseudopilin n=1 Tax=Maricaulis sp. MIT060901 TaxID=3096993 RepID=UPI00399B4884